MKNDKNVVQVPLEWAYRLINYGPVVLVTSTDGRNADISAVTWCAPCAKEPPTVMISIGKEHKTYKNIMKTGYFGINVPTAEQTGLVMYAGTASGHDEDKFAGRNLELRYGSVVEKLPLAADCVAWLECRIVPGVEAGDQSIIVARAVAAWARPGVLLPDHTWNTEKFPTLHHLGGRKFIVGRETVKA